MCVCVSECAKSGHIHTHTPKQTDTHGIEQRNWCRCSIWRWRSVYILIYTRYVWVTVLVCMQLHRCTFILQWVSKKCNYTCSTYFRYLWFFFCLGMFSLRFLLPSLLLFLCICLFEAIVITYGMDCLLFYAHKIRNFQL